MAQEHLKLIIKAMHARGYSQSSIMAQEIENRSELRIKVELYLEL